jgi:hypothetical protein
MTIEEQLTLGTDQIIENAYACGECGATAIVLPDRPIVRTCECVGTVVANMSGTVEGCGGMIG